MARDFFHFGGTKPMKKLIFILILMLAYKASSQSINLFDIDASEFPKMKAKFFAFDENGNQLRPNIGELQLSEDGINREITGVGCPPPQPPEVVSIAMSIDLSGSMLSGQTQIPPIDLCKNTGKHLIQILNMPPTEMALQIYSSSPIIAQNFTTDRELILTSLNWIRAGGSNDFYEHLLDIKSGLFNVAKTGKHKKIAILFTDAWWHSLSNKELQECKQICDEYNIKFFGVIYSRLESEPNGIKKSLQELADYTDGFLFDGVTSNDLAIQIANQLRSLSQVSSPCTIEWQSDYNCVVKTSQITLRNDIYNTFDSKNLKLSIASNPKLIASPISILFEDYEIGANTVLYTTVTAMNGDVEVFDIISSNNRFDINPKAFSLKEGESIILEVLYNAESDEYNFSHFSLITNICPLSIYAIGGDRKIRPIKPTLKLTRPNGGEKYIVGSDEMITWEGIAEDKEVKLEYSSDNGLRWNMLSENAKALEFQWINIPKPTSQNCLVRVSEIDEFNQPGNIFWDRNYGAERDEVCHSISPTNDNGYILTGFFNLPNIRNNQYNLVVNVPSVIKIDNSGNVIWQNSYSFLPELPSMYSYRAIELKSGNITVVGSQRKLDDSWQIGSGTDIWVLKLDSDGNELWRNNYGGSRLDYAHDVVETIDGNIIIAGSSNSADGDIGSHLGDTDIWLICVNPDGDIVWEKTYGGRNSELSNAIISTHDGNFVVVGQTFSLNGDITESFGSWDIWVFKIDPLGKLLWQRSLGGKNVDISHSLVQAKNGDILVCGYSNSKDEYVENNKGFKDYYVAKLDNDGNLLWQNTYGGSQQDIAYSIVESEDGGFVISGSSDSEDFDISENKGGLDFFVIKINDEGELLWTKNYGGPRDDIPYSMVNSGQGTVMIAGTSNSGINGDVSDSLGKFDFWLLKIYDNNILQSDQSDAVFAIVMPEVSAIDVDMEKCLVGKEKDVVFDQFISNIGTYKVRIDSIYIQGADAEAFMLVSGFPEYFIEAGDDYYAEFRFKPNRVGIHQAEIVIIHQADTLIKSIVGEGILPQIEVVQKIIDFGEVQLGEYKDLLKELTVRNSGTEPIEISQVEHSFPNDIDFTTLDGGGTFTLQPSEEHQMDLRFTPSAIGRTMGTLRFHHNGFDSPEVIQLFGAGYTLYNPKITIEVPEINSFSGLRINVPLLLKKGEDLEFITEDSFSADLYFNPTLLYPLDYQMNRVDEKTAFIRLENISLNKLVGESLADIRFRVALGNAENCELKVDNFEYSSPFIEASVENGIFTLLGICYEGGTRLLNPNAVAGIANISPNPADNSVNVTLSLSEVGETELCVYNILGEKVKSLMLEDIRTTGEREIIGNLSDLGNGSYYIVLITPSYITKENLMIIR